MTTLGKTCFAVMLMIAVRTLCLAQEDLPDRDISYSKSVEYTVKEHGDSLYTLTSKVLLSARLLSQRATNIGNIVIHEPYYAPIKKLIVKVNSWSVDNDQIIHGIERPTDEFLTGFRQYTVGLPSRIDTGAVITYSLRDEYSDIAFLPVLYVPNIDEVSEYKVLFKHPDDVTVDFEFSFPRDSIAYTIDRSKDDETSLSFGRIGYSDTTRFLAGSAYHVAVLCKLRRGARWITPSEPLEYARWYFRSAERAPRVGPAYRGMFDSLLAGKKSLADTLATIHDFVRTTIRYVADERGINAIIPRPPAVTLEKKFGDCKDRVALVAGIAAEYGIRVLWVLVAGDDMPAFKGVHGLTFNHMICAARTGAEWTFFDPTYEYCEFGNLPDHDVGKLALVMAPDTAWLTTIPVPARGPSLDITMEARADSLGACRAGIVLRNEFLSAALHGRHDLTREKFVRLLETFVADNLYQMKFDSFAVVDEKPGILKLSARADLSRFIIVSGEKLYVPRTAFALFDNDVLQREKDRYPIHFHSTIDLRLQLRLEAAGFEVQRDSVDLKSDRFSFSSSGGATGKGAQFDFRYTRNAVDIRPEDKESFVRIYKAYLANKRNVFVMKRKQP